MAKNDKPKFSEYISNFCRMITEAQRDYDWNYDEVHRLDGLTQDYLHILELDDLNYSERAKIATKLANCRKQRRESKDTVEILEPIIQYLQTDNGQQMMKLMKEILGKTRKVEEYMSNRSYRFRVIDTGDE